MEKIYGIDLGTTNSLIGWHGRLYTGLVPSVASIPEKSAGLFYKNRYGKDISRSFKTNMSLGVEGKEAILASTLVLKELITFAPEPVKKVVITVPAYFTDNERQATIQAANNIGLEVVSILNEPTAAALKYSRGKKKLSVVFDLGGGTFDVSVIDSRLDMYDVQSTDGLKIGGDDLDAAIRAYLIKKTRMAIHKFEKYDLDKLKGVSEKAKVQLQQTGKDVTIDLKEFEHCCDLDTVNLTVNDYKGLIRLTFEKTVILSSRVIRRAIIDGEDYDLILTGGSTRCPYLREFVEEELNKKAVPVDYNPDTLVAEGACVYAQMIEEGEIEDMVSEVTQALSIGLADGTVRNIIKKDSKVPIIDSVMVTNPEEASGIRLDLYQGESILAVNNKYIGTLEYDFNCVKKRGEANVKVTVDVTMEGTIRFSAKELLKTERQILLRR